MVRDSARRWALSLVATLAFASAGAGAHDYTLGKLRIGHPYARPTPPGARTGGAYLSIENAGTVPDRLLRVGSPVAGAVELHTMRMEGNLMRMRAIPALDLPPGKKVVLAPGEFHVMLVDLKRPLAPGDKVPLTLTFEKSGAIDVEADVEAPSGAAAAQSGHGH